MNSDALIMFLVLLGGPLTITIFFYGCQVLLRRLEMADTPQALASFESQTTFGAGSIVRVAVPKREKATGIL